MKTNVMRLLTIPVDDGRPMLILVTGEIEEVIVERQPYPRVTVRLKPAVLQSIESGEML